MIVAPFLDNIFVDSDLQFWDVPKVVSELNGHIVDFSIDMQVLDKLSAYLREGRIPYVFDARCNVLWDLPEEQQANTARFLENNVVKKLNAAKDTPDCFEVWVSYFEKKQHK